MRLLYDVHCHAMSLARPAIGRFVDAFLRGGLQSFFSQVAAPGYILAALGRNMGESVRNLFAVVENDPDALLELIENDLSGLYLSDDEAHRSVILPGGPKLLGEDWDGWLVCPLLMDFGARATSHDTYYCEPIRKSLAEGVREALAGVSGYRRERPNGRLVIRPFLGLDPGARGASETEAALSTYFSGFSRALPAQLRAFKSAARWKGDPASPPRNTFAGVKLYPPLGFDPWPEDQAALDATRLLYAFCERRGVPIVVHCDDQGYRTIALDLAMRYTDPERWVSALKAYPDLVVDFAHFGERYLGRSRARGAWTESIIRLMERYPGVYADTAFNGCEPAYWDRLDRFVASLPAATSEIVRSRLLFGTDFVISLTKTRSYLDYVTDFASSSLDDGLKRAMMTVNPAAFLFGAS
ncbi:MAG TPA: amidohydrolase family protein [Spirochaetales bacterium]|nr:amidohydrolase family protein [Spirochaetales bacterium]HPM71703.1 amidohydrolase family protein [Spirochaetales bacterium]